MKRLAFILVMALCAAQTSSSTQERLWHYRNLGKAYYENPTTQAQAVDVLKKALDMAPNSARERLNYGLALLRAGKTQEGINELLAVQKQDPKLPHTWFNLGIVYRKNGEFEKAIPEFQKMTELLPDEPISRYNLGVLYKQTGRDDLARKELETAERLNPNLAAPHFQLYNLYRQAGRRDDAARELAEFQRLKKQQEGAVIPEDMEWSDYAEIYDPIDIPDHAPPPLPRRSLAAGELGQFLMDLHGDGKPVLLTWTRQAIKIPGATGLESLTGIVSVAQGDYDNDGLPDLCVLTESAPVLLHNVRGRFERVRANLPAGRFEKAVWLDYDHDYDLDLFLFGPKQALLRNQGQAGFADHTRDFPFIAGHAIDAVFTRVMADSKAFDLVVSYADRPGVVYRDQLNGKYQSADLPELATGAKWLSAEDVNRDAWLDIVSSAGSLLNRHGRFERAAQPVANGSIELDKPPAAGRWIQVRLTGIKNLKLGYGSQVEVKAGALYQKKLYGGVPLIFALGPRATVDTVRTTWGNGLIQNEPNQRSDVAYDYKEAQRLSGSCPMIWTWNGKGFQFVTDVLGVAPLGASSGDGQFFPVDHQEYIQIPSGALVAQNGRLQVRVTEELSEVSYLDQVQLLAVDHPAGMDVVTSERWKGPPFPDFRMYGTTQPTAPVSARDHLGRDVRDRLLARDNRYVAGFRHDLSGVAELHWLDLDFGNAAPDNRAVLVLSGWVDWADGSTFLGRAQEGKGGLIPPYLQVKDSNGRWKTVIDDMGMPDGKPKTIAVDLTGKFLTSSRQVRIVTNLCVFWDQIYLATPSNLALNAAPVPALSAGLHFRGFSKNIVSPDREQPEQFIYNDVSSASQWNPTPGLYTRYGDVAGLLRAVDDRLVIMGSGDETSLTFDAASLPPPPAGWVRDYLLKVDGWAKDRDANTAFSQTVEPLPFHGMSAYPYGPREHFPTDAAHVSYRQQYLTRPAITLIPPLTSTN
jgi:tetratricopeptide (TPR) repeat protein